MRPGSFRFFLALIVVLFHIGKYVFLGHFAVYCFFMLSGYWISAMYVGKYHALVNPIRIFYISRFWRLLPIFILCVVLVALIRFFTDSGYLNAVSEQPLAQQVIFYFSNTLILLYNQNSILLLPPAWSLDIEVQFYLLFPLIFLVAGSKKNILILTCMSLVLTALLSTFFSDALISKTIVYFLPYFLIGILLFHFGNRITSTQANLSAAFCFLIIVVHYLYQPLRDVTMLDKESDYNRYLNELLPLLIVPFVSNSLNRPSGRWDKDLGNLAYVVYLLHGFWLIPYALIVPQMSTTNKIFCALAYLGLTFASSYLLYRLYDAPIDKKRVIWISQQKRSDDR